MTTNIRIESGGAFSIISQSLGLEIGGSIGIPLYFSQACVVAMYVFGFREGWLWVRLVETEARTDAQVRGIIQGLHALTPLVFVISPGAQARCLRLVQL